MVTRVLTDTTGGDTSDSNNGADADIISFASSSTAVGDIVIRTFANNDRVTLTSSNVGNRFAIFTGSGADKVTSGGTNDTVYDGSGNDAYALGAGFDIVVGGAGNDTYDGGFGSGDTLNFSFAPSEGEPELVYTGKLRIDLSLKTRQDLGTAFGKDIVLGFENVGTGNGSDSVLGTKGANQIQTNGGNDFIDGRAGNDTLTGGAGRDTYIGGSGADLIRLLDEGSAARDTVRYSSVLDTQFKSSTAKITTYDQIRGFDSGSEITADRIDLSRFSGTFKFVSKAGTSSAKEVWIEKVKVGGSTTLFDTIIHIDTDSDKTDEMRIYVLDASLSKIDFIL